VIRSRQRKIDSGAKMGRGLKISDALSPEELRIEARRAERIRSVSAEPFCLSASFNADGSAIDNKADPNGQQEFAKACSQHVGQGVKLKRRGGRRPSIHSMMVTMPAIKGSIATTESKTPSALICVADTSKNNI
jgi:hypothetical protein